MPSDHQPSQSGFTLLETVVSMSILSIVLVMTLTILNVVQRSVAKETVRSEITDEVRLAAQQVDKQIRSGNVLYAATSGGMALKIYTQANGTQKCVEWRIQGDQLQWRSWNTTWLLDGVVSGWRIAARDVVNATQSPPVPAFTLDTSQSQFGNRLMRISFLTQRGASNGRPARLDLSISGRNTEYGYPTSACDSAPAP